MAYGIDDLREIAPNQRKRLVSRGIKTTGELLFACCTSEGLNRLGAETDIDPSLLLRWARRADLMRISGIGRQFAELLEACDVMTVGQLRTQIAEELTAELSRVNAVTKLSRTSPGLTLVSEWIDRARMVRPMMISIDKDQDH